jgi:hypothetical protein
MITYKEFMGAFETAFNENEQDLLWNERKIRTEGMKKYIYLSIANHFGLSVQREYDCIDAVLYGGSFSEMMNDPRLIEVAIEHEDYPRTIHNELGNFVRHRFPLNVLITYPKMPTNDAERKATWVISSFGHLLKQIDGKLMLIFPGQDFDKHTLGKPIYWRYFEYVRAENRFEPIEANSPQ